MRVQGVLPDLVLVLVVYLAMKKGEEAAMWAGFVGGLFQDVAADTALGHHVLCLVIVGYGCGKLSTRLVTDHPAVRVGCVFLAAVVNGVIFTAIAYVQDPAMGAIHAVAVSVIPRAFYTALTTPILLLLLESNGHFARLARRKAA